MQPHSGRRCAVAAFLLLSTSAFAAPRTFVASTGNDANACSLAQPCRSFTTALSQTNDGGEIVVLDSAGYGPVTIAKSVTIVAPAGVHAAISVSAGDGIIVNAAGIDVALRGLTITGQGGSNGIRFLAGNTLSIERCVVSGMSSNGIRTDSGGRLRVKDSVVQQNGGGVRLEAGDATLVNVQIERNGGRGIDAGNARTSVQGGIVAHNGFEGISVHNVPTATTQMTIDGVTIAQNADDGVGVFSANSSGLVSVTVTNTTISANGEYGISVVGAVNGGPARLYATGNAIVDNGREGINAGTNVGSTVHATATRNLIAGNDSAGIRAGNSGTTMVADNNTVIRNTGYGLIQQGAAVFYTRNNNIAQGNTTTDSSGTLTFLGGE